MEEKAAWLRLGMTRGLSPAATHKLLAKFGLPQQIFAASVSALTQIVGEALADALKAPPDEARFARACKWLDHPQHHLVTLADPSYPRSLLEIADPPAMLFVHGEPGLLARPCLAMVGSRNPSPQGTANSEIFAHHLSTAGLTIVSGLALGIDAAAHRGALRGAGSTIAVLGTGIDVVYPMRNRNLTELIAREGALVSEFGLGTPPVPANFPRRNRIISGLARGVLVVEATASSGSLITARFGAGQGREVFAIPGSIHSPLSRGCHALIKDGAKLVESVSDVLSELNLPLPSTQPASVPPPMSAQRASALPPSAQQASAPPPSARRGGAPLGNAPQTQANGERISKPELDFLAVMGHDPLTPDMLCSTSGLTPDVVSAMLSRLELAGHVRSLPGGAYQRVVR